MKDFSKKVNERRSGLSLLYSSSWKYWGKLMAGIKKSMSETTCFLSNNSKCYGHVYEKA